MKNTCFSTIYCVRLNDNFFKLILPYTNTIPTKISELVNKKTRDKIEEEIIHTIGFLAGNCSVDGMIIREVEIIMPCMGEYLALQERLNDILSEKGLIFSVHTGVRIDLPKKELKDIDINKPLEQLAKKNIRNN